MHAIRILPLAGLVLQLTGCETYTNEVDPSTVSSVFAIEFLEIADLDADGNTTLWRDFEVAGNLYSRTPDSENALRLTLAEGERLTIFDGVGEYALSEGSSSGVFADEYVFYSISAPDFDMDAETWVLRYHRADGAVLESRIDVPGMPQILSPLPAAVWNPGAESLAVSWTPSAAPLERLIIYPHCVNVPYSEALEAVAVAFDVIDSLYLDIDLRDYPAIADCESDFTYLEAVQQPVNGDVDPAFQDGGEFVLHRLRWQDILEQT